MLNLHKEFGIKNLILVFIHTSMCVSTVYSVLPQARESTEYTVLTRVWVKQQN